MKKVLLLTLSFMTLSCVDKVNSEGEREEINEIKKLDPPNFICDPGHIQFCSVEENRGPCKGGMSICYGNFWSPCSPLVSPSEELCNGVDDDCDGPIDEGLTKKIPCEVEETNQWIVYNDVLESSSCTRGWRLCVDGELTECQGFTGPSEEICDEYDNDCDGEINEELVVREECGISNIGVCSLGREICVEDELICLDARLPEAETCNDLDDDCDGQTDEELYRPCETICNQGIERCEQGSWVGCTADSPREETCNGIDDNCDGQVDEGLVCPCQVGERRPCLANPCGYGLETCLGTDGWSECIGSSPQPETCNNHDDDCDDIIDGIQRECFSGDEALLENEPCAEGLQTCLLGNWSPCYDETLPTQEICDDIDNDCDGLIDNLEIFYEKADIVFILDFSGSMADTLGALLSVLRQYVSSFSGSDHKFALVAIGAGYEQQVELVLNLSRIEDFITTLETVNRPGSGWEASLDSIYWVADPVNPLGINWRPDAAPFALLFTDEQLQKIGRFSIDSVERVISSCALPGCNSQTNTFWVDGNQFEFFIFTYPNFYLPWRRYIFDDRERLFNLERVLSQEQIEADLDLIFLELCLEE